MKLFDGIKDFMSQNIQIQAYCSDLVSDWVHSDDVTSYMAMAENKYEDSVSYNDTKTAKGSLKDENTLDV